MGKKGRESVKDVDKVIGLLNKAFCDEWLAYYQYWVGAKVVEGPMKDAVAAELLQHAADELRHADMISNRIIQLGGDPILEPKAWYDHTNCGYEAPSDHFVKKVLQQNIDGERCAIDVYNKLLAETRDTDPVTYNMVVQILQDEVEHEEDLETLSDDLEVLTMKHAGV